MLMKTATDNPLWQWSIKTYQQKNVAEALLALQDEGEDVLWLLYLLWCQFETPGSTALNQLSADYLKWRDSMIRPIRQLRIQCDKESRCRSALLDAELAAEQHGIALLYADHLAWVNRDSEPSPNDQGSGADKAKSLIRDYAGNGRTDLLSPAWSHLLSLFKP